MAQGIGLKFPLRQGKTGYFEQTFTTIDAAKTNLINLLLTNKGERYMQPEFGADISRLLFENITAELSSIIEQNIRQAVAFWLPYINLVEINVDTETENVDRNRVVVTITFGVIQVPNIFDTIVLEFNF